MGNAMDSQTNSQSHRSQSNSDPIRKQFEHLKSPQNEFITHERFLELIPHHQQLSHCLWNKFASTETATLDFHIYTTLLTFCDERRDKIGKLASVLLEPSGDTISEQSCHDFLKFFFLLPLDGYEKSSEFIFDSFKSTTPPSPEGLYPKEEFITWLNRNMPDLAEDIFTYARDCLTTGHGRRPDVMKLLEKCPSQSVLTPELAVYLSFILPSTYKYGFSMESNQLIPYELEKLTNWTLLFSTARDGTSVSRFVDCVCEYLGPMVILLKTESSMFCVASDAGLVESYQPFGDSESRLFQLYPTFKRMVSGTVRRDTNSSKTGMIYCHFNTQTGRRGLSVGHQPMQRPVLEVDADLTYLAITGLQMRLYQIEVWAAGDDSHWRKFIEQKKWNKAQVEKNKNRKYKLDDWADSPDRHILSWGGVNVSHSEALEPVEKESK